MLDIVELSDLEDDIRAELDERLTEILTKLNRSGKLEEFMELIGLDSILTNENGYSVRNNGKIVVVGQSDVKADVLLAILKNYGIDKNRVEMYLDYEDAKTLNFGRMQWNPDYSVIMVGPMPHSGNAKGDYNGIINALENEAGYPPVVRLGSNSLKITKSDFKEKLTDLIQRKMIA